VNAGVVLLLIEEEIKLYVNMRRAENKKPSPYNGEGGRLHRDALHGSSVLEVEVDRRRHALGAFHSKLLGLLGGFEHAWCLDDLYPLACSGFK
jgi:hypothetical protein